MLRRPPARRRRGTIVPFLAISVVALFMFVALAIDLGVLTVARTEAQDSADAAALSGARVLNNRPTTADNDRPLASTTAEATVYTNYNLNTKYTAANITFPDPQPGDPAATRKGIDVGLYSYDTAAKQFAATFPATKTDTQSWSAVRVTVKADQPTYFARVFGVLTMPAQAQAVAVHRPRDIAIVLDYSGSMKFGSQFNWESGYNGDTSYVYGSLTADDVYPQYGHYARYAGYKADIYGSDTTKNLAYFNTTPAARPNPMYKLASHPLDSGEVMAPSNMTVETPGGPPLVLDFRFNPSNRYSPATKVTSPDPTNQWNAFDRWMTTTPNVENLFADAAFRPAVTSTSAVIANGVEVAKKRTFNWSGYNAFDRDGTSGPTPAPDFFKDQSDGTVAYVGDRSPRKGGQIFTASTTWDPTTTTGAATDVIDILTKAGTARISAAARTTAPTTLPTGYTFPAAGDGGNAFTNFRDDLWEKYGYDLDLAKYSGTNPGGTNRTAAAVRTTDLFNGFGMGPGYYGKTFFVWPPDPRFDPTADVTSPNTNTAKLAQDSGGKAMCDWRRRFFIKGGLLETNLASRLDPQADSDPVTAGVQGINETLFNPGPSATLAALGTPIPTLKDSASGTKYKVNYRAVLAWLKSGPLTLPSNLRAGRILYYSSIPNDCDDLTDADKRFWRDYIDFVLGFNGNGTSFNPLYNLAGGETAAWPEGASGAIGTTAAYNANPKPYMNYADNPARPRMHFWFGPLTMLDFLACRYGSGNGIRYWMPGTAHEAQCWQLKAGMSSALDDIRNNHPNDYCGLTYFASNSKYYTPRVPCGQDWNRLKGALYYPYSMLDTILPPTSNTTAEVTPYDLSKSGAAFQQALVANLPNADGGTDPVSGFAAAFNLLSSSNATSAATTPSSTLNGGTGRRGASKIVIFETDGSPNGRPGATYQAGGVNSYYQIGTGVNPGVDAGDDAVQIVNKMRLPALSATSGTSGLSTGSAPCRVYAIAFGDMFAVTPEPATTTAAKAFLLDVQQAGGTSAATDTALPASNIITGPYATRIANLKDVMQRIMQSGVQVTLVQ